MDFLSSAQSLSRFEFLDVWLGSAWNKKKIYKNFGILHLSPFYTCSTQLQSKWITACMQTLLPCVLVLGQHVWIEDLDGNIPAPGWLLQQAQQLADSRHATAKLRQNKTHQTKSFIWQQTVHAGRLCRLATVHGMIDSLETKMSW